MKWWLIPLIIILAFVQTTITDFDLLLFIVLTIAMVGNEKESLLLAFFSGLLFDLLSGPPTGGLALSSITYLSLVLLVILYKRKFLTANFWFWLVFFELSAFLTKLIRGAPWHWWQAVLTAVLVSVTFWLLGRIDLFGMSEDEEGIRLKV